MYNKGELYEDRIKLAINQIKTYYKDIISKPFKY